MLRQIDAGCAIEPAQHVEILVERLAVCIRVGAPHGVNQIVPRDERSRMARELLQDADLFRRELHGGSIRKVCAQVGMDHGSGEFERDGGQPYAVELGKSRRLVSAPGNLPLDSRSHFPESEWLSNIVVGTRRKRLGGETIIVVGGRDDYGESVTARAPLTDHVQPGRDLCTVGEVHDRNVDIQTSGHSQRVLYARNGMEDVAVDAFEESCEYEADIAVVFEQEDVPATLAHRLDFRAMTRSPQIVFGFESDLNAPPRVRRGDRLSDGITTLAVIAVMREVAASSHRRNPGGNARASVDVELARSQHGELARVMGTLGVKVKFAPGLADDPRGAIVEEAIVVLPEMGILARPQNKSGGADAEPMVALLAQHRPIQRIVDPALLDGRDVLRIGRTLYVAPTATTSGEGIAELRAIVEPFGYDLREVELHGCPHLKLAASFVPPHYLVLNPAWADSKQFGDLVVLGVDEREPLAASTLPVNGTTLVSGAYPKTERRLRNAGITIRRVDVSEFHKMETGLSSLAVIVEPRAVRSASSPVGFKVIQTATAPGTRGLFASAIVHGGVVYVSGQLPIDPATGRAVDGEIEDQTNQVLRNLSDVLSASGSSLGRVLRLTCYVADTKHVDRVTAACALALTGHRPAGSVVAARMLHPGCAIAVDAIAAVSDER